MARLPTRGEKLTGLIGAASPGGVKGAADEWNLVIHLAAMRTTGAEVTQGEFRCELPVSRDGLESWMGRLRPYQILDAEVDAADARCIVLREITALDVADTALSELATRLKQPVSVSHDVLGALTLNREFCLYEGHVSWMQREVAIELECAEPDEPGPAIDNAVRLVGSQQAWWDRITTYAVDELLELKNESWREDGEADVSASEFLERLSLESISVSSEGKFSFWFDDGGLFWGHAVVVAGSLETGPDRADIAG